MGFLEENLERSYPERFKWDAELRYKLYHQADEHPFVEAKVSTIGRKGVSFFISENIPVSSILVIKLYRYQDYAPVKVLVKVGQVHDVKQEELFEVDCSFHDLDDAGRMAVDEIVEEVCFIHRIHSTVKESLEDKDLAPKVKHKPKKNE